MFIQVNHDFIVRRVEAFMIIGIADVKITVPVVARSCSLYRYAIENIVFSLITEGFGRDNIADKVIVLIRVFPVPISLAVFRSFLILVKFKLQIILSQNCTDIIPLINCGRHAHRTFRDFRIIFLIVSHKVFEVENHAGTIAHIGFSRSVVELNFLVDITVFCGFFLRNSKHFLRNNRKNYNEQNQNAQEHFFYHISALILNNYTLITSRLSKGLYADRNRKTLRFWSLYTEGFIVIR